jgi:hypothetical protein
VPDFRDEQILLTGFSGLAKMLCLHVSGAQPIENVEELDSIQCSLFTLAERVDATLDLL